MSRNDEWKVGDKVQRENDDKTFTTGEVTEVHTKTEQRRDYNSSYYGWNRSEPKMIDVTFVEKLTVKWADGTEETDSTWHFQPEDNEFERAFRVAADSAADRINEKLDLASQYLSEACKISEETGVPFSSGISFLSQSYMPGSFRDKFPEVDTEFRNSITDAYGEYDGWQHSAVC